MLVKAQNKVTDLINRGIQVSRPYDRLDPSRYLQLINVRSYQDGSIRTRPPLQRVSTTPIGTPIHSMRRLNTPAIPGIITQTQTIVAGSGAGLYTYDQNFGTPTLQDTGYSGNPL